MIGLYSTACSYSYKQWPVFRVPRGPRLWHLLAYIENVGIGMYGSNSMFSLEGVLDWLWAIKPSLRKEQKASIISSKWRLSSQNTCWRQRALGTTAFGDIFVKQSCLGQFFFEVLNEWSGSRLTAVGKTRTVKPMDFRSTLDDKALLPAPVVNAAEEWWEWLRGCSLAYPETKLS